MKLSALHNASLIYIPSTLCYNERIHEFTDLSTGQKLSVLSGEWILTLTLLVVALKKSTDTFMAKNISTLAILSENPMLLSENLSIANVFVFTCLLFLFALQQYKKTEEKSNLIKFYTEFKNGLDKIIATLSK